MLYDSFYTDVHVSPNPFFSRLRKKAVKPLPLVAAQKGACVFARTYRAATRGSGGSCVFFPSLLGIILAFCGQAIMSGQTRKAVLNYNEAKVPPYVLPDPLRLADGTRVTSAPVWWERRRPELVRLFETHVYGRTPGQKIPVRFETTSVDRDALDGRAVRKEVSIPVLSKLEKSGDL